MNCPEIPGRTRLRCRELSRRPDLQMQTSGDSETKAYPVNWQDPIWRNSRLPGAARVPPPSRIDRVFSADRYRNPALSGNRASTLCIAVRLRDSIAHALGKA